MTERVAPSARIEAHIERLLRNMDDREGLAERGRLGARLVLQRSLEEEVPVFLGGAPKERPQNRTPTPWPVTSSPSSEASLLQLPDRRSRRRRRMARARVDERRAGPTARPTAPPAVPPVNGTPPVIGSRRVAGPPADPSVPGWRPRLPPRPESRLLHLEAGGRRQLQVALDRLPVQPQSARDLTQRSSALTLRQDLSNLHSRHFSQHRHLRRCDATKGPWLRAPSGVGWWSLVGGYAVVPTFWPNHRQLVPCFWRSTCWFRSR